MDKFWRDKRVLITGANGFLASHLSVSLLKKGAQVTGIIKQPFRNSYLDIALKNMHNSKLVIIKSDIVNFESIVKIFMKYKPDICMHVAAQAIVGIANKSPLSTFETNIKGTWNILEIARLCKVKATVVASSDKAYGEHKKLPYREDAMLQGLHPYDASKTCTDLLTRCYANTYALPTAVTRCANIYGPGDFNFSRLIPDTMRSAILDKSPVIRSDGMPVRDYIFIDDAVSGYLILARSLYNRNIKPGEAFNFGNQKPISVLRLVNKILKIAQKPYLSPVILSKQKIKGEIDKQYLSSKKANSVLGWVPEFTLDKGLKTTFKWYKHYLLPQL